MLPEKCPLAKSLIDIKHLFTVVNNKLLNIKYSLTVNQLSLNVEKTKYSFSRRKPTEKDDISLRLQRLIINNYEIQREKSIKLLEVLLDKHLTGKEIIKLTKNKIVTWIYKARLYVDKRALLCLYHSYIHAYLNYANTRW